MKKSLLVIAFLSSLTFSYTYDAYTGMTGAKTFAINPFFHGPLSALGETGTDLVVGYGLKDNIDVFANLATLSPIKDGTYGGSWIMPRLALTENHIVALSIGTDKTSLTLAPQYHFYQDLERWVLEFNVVNYISSADFGAGTLWATCGGVYKLIPDVLYPFLEFNPSFIYGEESAFDFTIAPGIWIGLKDTPHQISLSVPISGIKAGEVSAGINLWYWYSFSLGSK